MTKREREQVKKIVYEINKEFDKYMEELEDPSPVYTQLDRLWALAEASEKKGEEE